MKKMVFITFLLINGIVFAQPYPQDVVNSDGSITRTFTMSHKMTLKQYQAQTVQLQSQIKALQATLATITANISTAEGKIVTNTPALANSGN